MQKRTYYIPTIEVITLGTSILMQEWLAGSNDHGPGGGKHAPEHREKAY